MSININLKKLRLQRKLTQGELARIANIELTQISRIERGASEPKLETIKKLALALKCTTDQLIMEQDSKTNEPQYLKVLLTRIDKLSPLKKYVILDMLECYLNTNQIQEPSIMQQYGNYNVNEFDYEEMVEKEMLTVLEDEQEIVNEIDKDLHEHTMYLGTKLSKK